MLVLASGQILRQRHHPWPCLRWSGLLLTLFASLVAANNESQPISIFRSRPDLEAPILGVFLRERDLQAPGFYFAAPYQQIQEAVHIFDNDANLVWTGFGANGPGISHSPQVCNYHGEPHLCFFQGTQMVGWGHGHGVIMDKHYRIVKSLEPGSYQASSDMHEFFLLPDGKSALMSQYLRGVQNLCQYGICEGLGYVNQGAFEEVEVDTGKVLFEWRSLDHVALNESYVLPRSTEISGSGEQPQSPWDYFHINSIDKNADGDYLVSARHTCAIYKVSGKDGHIIWRLNGKLSDYHLDNFGFSYQHDARWVSDNEDETVISVFDNASNGFTKTELWSSGKVITLNHRTKVATLTKKYDPPKLGENRHTAKSQGNMQRLPNGNVLLGWGSDAFWTEYTEDGTVVFYGNLGWTNLMNYRIHKFDNWVGLPLTKPALWTYSKFGGSQDDMFLYVSWNGATEIRSWQFYASNSKNGPWKLISTMAKQGFETIVRLDQSAKYTYAVALDKNLQVLGTSAIQETYVPNEELRPYCDDLACKFMPTGEERDRQREEEARREREKIEQEQEQEQHEQELREEQHEKVMRLVESTLGGLAGVIVLLLLYCTRQFTAKPIARFRVRLGEVIAGQSKGTYRKLAMEESEGVCNFGS